MILSPWCLLFLALTTPSDLTVKDTPNDEGSSITLKWTFPEEGEVGDLVGFSVQRADSSDDFAEVDRVPGKAREYADESTTRDTPYRYRVAAVYPDTMLAGEASPEIMSTAQWLNWDRFNILVGLLVFSSLVVYFVTKARSGAHLFVRRIAGLEAVDEAVGRATEMGRAIFYIPGTGYVESIATIASMNLLGEIAKKAAEYGTHIKVPNKDPIVFTVTREIVKGAYLQVGKPDAFDPDCVSFLVENVLAYASTIDGMMMREKPATIFLMGSFGAESLIMAETGAAIGAIQISGTDSTTQLPFFVVACDYTLLGEELYAASAYLSREPLMLGALKGQDWGKAIIAAVLLITSLLALAFNVDVSPLFRYQ
jgi:hypothetical protein